MDRQTQMNSNGTEEHPVRDVTRSATELWHHLLLLGELQMQLLAVEFVAGLRQAKLPCIVLAIGCLLALAALPVAWACLALVLAENTALSLAGAFAATLASAVLVSGMLIAWGWHQLRKQAPRLPRTRDEWKSNWSWLKETSRVQHERKNTYRDPTNGRI